MNLRKTLLLSVVLASSVLVSACAGGNGETNYRLTQEEMAMMRDSKKAHRTTVVAKRHTKSLTIAKANPTKRDARMMTMAQLVKKNSAILANAPQKPRTMDMAVRTTPVRQTVKPLAVHSIMQANNHSTGKKPIRSLVFAARVNDKELTTVRGAFAPDTFDWAALTANSRNNTLSGNSVTGANFVTDSAFNNAQGLVNVIQNSGNNVIIQSATIVNLTLK